MFDSSKPLAARDGFLADRALDASNIHIAGIELTHHVLRSQGGGVIKDPASSFP
jgi:hypothetical protein